MSPHSLIVLILAAASAAAHAEALAPTVASVIAKAANQGRPLRVEAVCENGRYRSSTHFGGSGLLPGWGEALASAILQNALLDRGANSEASLCREESATGFMRADFDVQKPGLLMQPRRP